MLLSKWTGEKEQKKMEEKGKGKGDCYHKLQPKLPVTCMLDVEVCAGLRGCWTCVGAYMPSNEYMCEGGEGVRVC